MPSNCHLLQEKKPKYISMQDTFTWVAGLVWQFYLLLNGNERVLHTLTRDFSHSMKKMMVHSDITVLNLVILMFNVFQHTWILFLRRACCKRTPF